MTITPMLQAAPLPAYSTPQWLAQAMLHYAQVRSTDHLLDPCAGTGGILAEAKRLGAGAEYYELSIRRHQELRAAGWSGQRGDMRLLTPLRRPSVVALNTDFRNGKWVTMLASALSTAETQGSRAVVAVLPRGWMSMLEPHRELLEYVMRAIGRSRAFRDMDVADNAFANLGEPVLVNVMVAHMRLPD